jgi:predicted AAA+ superfamily ATPase
MKKAKETLAGRIIEIPLWPLSQKELKGKSHENIIDILFSEGIGALEATSVKYSEIFEWIVYGGYREIQKITS